MKTWFKDLLEILLPRICPVCGKRLMETDHCLCMSCRMKLVYMVQAKPEFAQDTATCKLFWGQIPVERATSFIEYHKESLSHQILVQLKYRHRPDIAKDMGEMMAQELKTKDFFQDIDYIVPIPLHWTRQLRRGYNQSEWIAKGISEATGIPIANNVVKRIRANKTQTHLDKQGREKNVRNIFKVQKNIELKNMHILIVDDVMTTGSTIISCGREIAKVEPTISISILTLARASL